MASSADSYVRALDVKIGRLLEGYKGILQSSRIEEDYTGPQDELSLQTYMRTIVSIHFFTYLLL